MEKKKPGGAPRDTVGIFWEAEITKTPAGSVSLKAIIPTSHMSRKQAAQAIGCSEWTISDLFRLGFLKGYKPGARTLVRKDGKASNAKLRICSESVLAYKNRQEQAAKDWLDAQWKRGGARPLK